MCHTLNASLVSIHSVEEHKYIDYIRFVVKLERIEDCDWLFIVPTVCMFLHYELENLYNRNMNARGEDLSKFSEKLAQPHFRVFLLTRMDT